MCDGAALFCFKTGAVNLNMNDLLLQKEEEERRTEKKMLMVLPLLSCSHRWQCRLGR